MTTRGCPFLCTFCAAHSVNGRKVRMRSVEKVIEEITLLNRRYGVTLIDVNDDLFNANKARTLAILERVRNLGIPDLEIQFPAGLNIGLLDEDIIEALIACRVTVINLALESGSAYVQKHVIKKNVDLRKTKRLVDYCRDRGLIVRCFVIFGFPGETRELMEETADYLRALKSDWCTMVIATPLMGSELYDQFLALGYIREDMDMLSHQFFRERTFDTREIRAADLKEFIYRLNLEINFLNNPNLGNGGYNKAVDLFTDIALAYPFHVFAWWGLHKAHQGRGDMEGAEHAARKVRSLAVENEPARAMIRAYRDLMPDALKALVDGAVREAAGQVPREAS